MTVANAKITTNSLALAMGYVRGPWSVVRSPSRRSSRIESSGETRTTNHGLRLHRPPSPTPRRLDCRVSTRSSPPLSRAAVRLPAQRRPCPSEADFREPEKRPPLIFSLRSRPAASRLPTICQAVAAATRMSREGSVHISLVARRLATRFLNHQSATLPEGPGRDRDRVPGVRRSRRGPPRRVER